MNLVCDCLLLLYSSYVVPLLSGDSRVGQLTLNISYNTTFSPCSLKYPPESIWDASCLTELEPARPQLSPKAGLYQFSGVRS